jgi:hypothetical protein
MVSLVSFFDNFFLLQRCNQNLEMNWSWPRSWVATVSNSHNLYNQATLPPGMIVRVCRSFAARVLLIHWQQGFQEGLAMSLSVVFRDKQQSPMATLPLGY